MVLTQQCRKLSVNPNLSFRPMCYQLVNIHSVLSIRTVFIERFVGLFTSTFVCLLLFLGASDCLWVCSLVQVLNSFLFHISLGHTVV